MTKKVYKNKQGEIAMAKLYEKQLKALNVPYEDLWAETRFGKAHIVKLGKLDGKPLLLFHGGNSTTPYYLAGLTSLFKHFCIYAVDTVGHPGMSSQTVVSAKSLAYGEWASDVIKGLGFKKMCCIGGSYGGGVLVKLMCAAPDKVEKAVLIVPSGIANVSPFSVITKMGMPMFLYVLTRKDYWLKKSILPMAIEEKNIDTSTYEMVKTSFEHAAVKSGMPSNAPIEVLKKCTAPTLLIAAEKDCLFPGQKVIERAKKAIPNLETYLLKNQGHLCTLSIDVQDMIRQFIDK